MTNNINGVGINTGAVNSYVPQSKKEDVKTGENPETETSQESGKTLNPDDVLTFMAQQANIYKPANLVAGKYDISKYVTPEQAKNIAGFVASFEDAVAEGLIDIDEEFGNILSDAAKYEIAANMAGPKAS